MTLPPDSEDRDKCAACGHVFYLMDELPEDDDYE